MHKINYNQRYVIKEQLPTRTMNDTHMLLISKHWLENLRIREHELARLSLPLAKADNKAECVLYDSCQIRLSSNVYKYDYLIYRQKQTTNGISNQSIIHLKDWYTDNNGNDNCI